MSLRALAAGPVEVKLITPDIYIALALVQSVVFLLLIRFLDLYEREPLSVLALMAAWGAIGAGILSQKGNEAVLGLLPQEVRVVFGPAISGPLVEELAKGLALVAAFVLSHWAFERYGWLEFEGITDGIVYGAAVGLGFAFTEDLFYLFDAMSSGIRMSQEAGLREYLERVAFFGTAQLGHGIYTGAFGAGLGLATWSRSWTARVSYSALGLGAAMLMHAVHNGLVNLVLVLRYGMEATAAWRGGLGYVPPEVAQRMQATADATATARTLLDYAFVAAFFLMIALWLWYQRRVIRRELAEEIDSGLISREEWEIMPRYWRRSVLYWRMLHEGRLERWRLTRRVHNELVDLAFLKWRLKKVGGDWGQVERRWRRIANLKSQRVVE